MQTIEVRVTSLEIEDSHSKTDSACPFDWLVIHDGPNVSAPILGGRLCGSVPPADKLVTSSNAALINFRSDPFGGGVGFVLNYRVVLRLGAGKAIHTTYLYTR
jgi:CUB domain